MKPNVFLVSLCLLLLAFFLILVPAFDGQLVIPPAFYLGPIMIRWYGIILAASVWVGFLVSVKFSGKFGITRRQIEDFAFWLVLVSFLSARLYFIFFAINYFAANPLEIFQVWHGGLSIYGALIGGTIFTYFWTRHNGYGFGRMTDVVALALPLSQALGRLGNFINSEAFGLPTELPWKMFVAPEFRPPAFGTFEYFHPTFLYEALLLVAVYFILTRLAGKLKSGVLAACYLGLYSVIRFFIEPLRLDSVWLGQFRADQVVALVLILVCGVLILIKQFRSKEQNVVS